MPKRQVRADDIKEFHLVSDPQISPDGSRILFTKGKVGTKTVVVSNLFAVEVDGGKTTQLTQGEGGNSFGRWAPDGKSIAFISGREKPCPQIFTLSMAGGEAVKATSLPEGSIGDLKWSPDGKQIAFTFRETAENRTAAAAKARQETGESTPPWEIDSIFYRMDGDGYFGMQRFRLYVLDVAIGKHSLLSKASPTGTYSFDWLPDSSGLIVGHSAAKDPLLDKPNDQLYHVPLSGKAKMIKGLSAGHKGHVTVSPDGRTVAFLGDVSIDDPWGVRNVRLYVAPVAGGEQVCLTESDDYCLAVSTLSDTGAGCDGAVEWRPDGKAIRVMVGFHGTAQIGEVPFPKGGLRMQSEGTHCLAVGNMNNNGKRQAVTIAEPTRLAEVGVFDEGRLRKLTDFNGAWRDEVKIHAPETVWVESTDGVKVQAWIIRPSGKKSYPAILEVHGGPHTQYGEAFFHEFQLLVAQGYAVVYSNPRGSKGYGEAFCAAIRGDWGNKDWDDVQAVTKWMQAQPEIKSSHIGIMGGSYGGYMTNWAIGHSKEYRAAITDRCVSNWLSASGNSDFPLNRDGYFGGYAWGDLAAIAKLWQQSPISHFEGVSTPTLVIHSEGDLRCNVEQSEQVFFALKSQGVETRFVRYPNNTSHGMSRNGPPDMKIHRLGEILAWWKKHLD